MSMMLHSYCAHYVYDDLSLLIRAEDVAKLACCRQYGASLMASNCQPMQSKHCDWKGKETSKRGTWYTRFTYYIHGCIRLRYIQLD